MKRGNLILYSGNGIIPWLIKRITKSKWSHVALILGHSQVLESDSSTNGVVTSPLNKYVNAINVFKKKIKIVELTYISEDELNKVIMLSLEKLGHKYDYTSVAYLAWRYFLGLFGIKVRVSQIKKNRDTCVELIALPLLLVAGWRTHKGTNVNETVPGDFDTSPFTKEIE